MKNSFESIKTWSEVQNGLNDRNLENYPSADLKILKKLEATADFCIQQNCSPKESGVRILPGSERPNTLPNVHLVLWRAKGIA